MTRKLVSIGVDVGTKNGAIGVIDEDLNVLQLLKAPYISQEIKSKKKKKLKVNKETGLYEVDYKVRTWTDSSKLRGLFLPYTKNKVVYTVEKVFTKLGEGEQSAFIFGNSLGVFQGCRTFLNPIYYEEPRPQEWKKVLNLDSDKSKSIDLVTEIFNCDLTKYTDGKVDDVAEALLLAFYGLVKYNESGK